VAQLRFQANGFSPQQSSAFARHDFSSANNASLQILQSRGLLGTRDISGIHRDIISLPK
jgi:hypothetical protein